MANLLKKMLTLLHSREEIREIRDEDEEKEEEKSKWELFSEDILGEFIRKLNLRDAVRMGMVCKSSRSALQNHVHNIHTGPWMMLPYERETNCVRFFDLCEGSLYKFNLPKKLKGANWFCGSSKGWIIMANGPRLNPVSSLFNPISGVQIQLPPFTTIPSFHTYLSELKAPEELGTPYNIDGFFDKFELSSVYPTEGIVAGIIFPYNKLAICRPNDKSWTIWDFDTTLQDILFSNGVLHALIHTELHYLETHPMRVGDEDVSIKILSVPPPENINLMGEDNETEFEFGWTIGGGGFESYLVESNGEYLLVHKMYDLLITEIEDDRYDNIYQFSYFSTREFQVFKIDHPTNTSIKTTRLNSFDDQILFVSKYNSCSLDRNLNGLEGNCIFFLDENGHYHAEGEDEGDDLGENLLYCESHPSRESGIFYLKDEKILRAFPSFKNSPSLQMCWFLPSV